MALEGDLQTAGLPRALHALSVLRQNGILTVQGEEDIVAVSVLEGGIVAADSLNQTTEEALGEMLEERGLVSQQDFAAIAQEHQESGAGSLGDLLVNQKAAVSRDVPVMAVVDLSRFEVDAQIPESYADDLGLGMNAEIRYGGDTYPGTLSALSPQVVNNEVVGRVRFEGDAPAGLRQNQRVSTRVILSSKDDVMKVRRGPFLESGGGRRIYLVDGDMAVARPIVTGTRSLTEVEIVSGLDVGDTIILSDTSRFDGAETVLLRE